MILSVISPWDSVVIGNESAPIQLAQCRFPGLANSNAKNKYIFSNKTFRKQFYQTARGNCYMVWRQKNAYCSLKNKFIVAFILVFGTLSFRAVQLSAAWLSCCTAMEFERKKRQNRGQQHSADHSSYPRLSLLSFLTNTLPGPSASEVTTLRRYTNLGTRFTKYLTIYHKVILSLSQKRLRRVT